ncbi:MAG: hypothetical protein IJZ70_03755 [Bacteroidales bacterium]|nr:hypothetical protein [Bacteroidales bacterium]
MTGLFCPVASGVVFSSDSVYDISRIVPEDTAGLREIAWQHYGVDLGKWSNSYVSKRTYRDQESQGLNRLVFEAGQSFLPERKCSAVLDLRDIIMAGGFLWG